MMKLVVSRVTRRDFLKHGSLALAASVASASLLRPGPGLAQARLSGTVKIGLLLPFSGPFALLGQEQLNGAQTYLRQAGGTLDGLQVEFVQEDSQGNPAIGLQKAQKLVESSKVDITAGIISSAVALAVRDYFHRNRKLLVISNASANAITREGRSRYIFRASVSSWQNSYPLGAWALKNVGKSAVLIGPDFAMGREIEDGFAEAYTKAGGKVVSRGYAPLGTTDYAPFLSGLRASGADFVYAAFAGSDALNFVKQYAQFGLKGRLPLIGVGSLTTNDVLPAQGTAALGIRVNYPYTPALDNPVNKAFVAAYRQQFNVNPSPYAMWGYDAIQLIHKGLVATKGDKDIEKLIPAMEAVKLESPRGPISFDRETHNVIQQQYLLEVQQLGGGLENVPIGVLGTFSDRAQVA